MTERRPPFEPTDRPSFATFSTETVEKPDGRQVTYYSWPDSADQAAPDEPPGDGEPDTGPDRV